MCTTYYAREIPSYNRSELLCCGEWDGLAAIVSPVSEPWQKELTDAAKRLCNFLYEAYDCQYEKPWKPFYTALDDFFKEETPEYERELVCDEYNGAYQLAECLFEHNGTNSPECICRALELLTEKHWDYREIHGSVQSEWGVLYYTPEVKTDITTIESAYFGRFRTIMVHDGYVYSELSDPMQVDGYVFESFENDDTKIKEEIRTVVGAEDDDEVVFWKFDGFFRLPNYVAV